MLHVFKGLFFAGEQLLHSLLLSVCMNRQFFKALQNMIKPFCHVRLCYFQLLEISAKRRCRGPQVLVDCSQSFSCFTDLISNAFHVLSCRLLPFTKRLNALTQMFQLAAHRLIHVCHKFLCDASNILVLRLCNLIC